MISDDPLARGSTTYDVEADAVVIAIPGGAEGDIELISHEFKHGYQFEVGELDLAVNGITGKYNLAHDIYDEQDAYNRGIMFGGVGKNIESIKNEYDILNNRTAVIQGVDKLIESSGMIKYVNMVDISNQWIGFSHQTFRAFRLGSVTYKSKIKR